MNKELNNLKIQKLKEQKKVIDARIKKMEAIESTKKRKQQKHLKYLVGEYFLNDAVQNGTVGALKEKLLGTLKRESDKVFVQALEESEAL